MNYLKRWMERRRNRRASDEITKRTRDEEREKHNREKLKDATNIVQRDLVDIGFKVAAFRSTNNEVTIAMTTAIGPDGRVYELSVYRNSAGHLLKRIK